MLLIESVILKCFLSCEGKTSPWMQISTSKLKESNLGRILVNESYDREPEDVNQLVENLNQSVDDAKVRLRICIIIDRVLLACLVILFSFMIFVSIYA
jgi:hypothetical protein